MLTVITCTKNRKHNFSLLERYMRSQTVKPDQWIVVNDGEEEYRYTMGQDVVIRDPIELREIRIGRVLHSLCHNLLAAFPLVRGDKVALWDDDDYFSPHYLARMSQGLQESPLVGFIPAKYWNCACRSAGVLNNTEHASLTCTGFRREVLPLFKTICEEGCPFVDLKLWQRWTGERLFLDNLSGGLAYQVGIKGTFTMNGKQKGSSGIGAGHEPLMNGHGFWDFNCDKLREWIGDISEYEGIHK